MATSRAPWTLDPAITFLNHGSFGACPQAVLDAQQALRAEIEREPVRFFVRALPGRLDAARARLAAFVGADPANLVFVRNATEAVNAVVRSLDLRPGDHLLTTDHAYNACRNVLEYVAERSAARVNVATIPFPIARPEEATAAILAAVTPQTRLALIDHVTSPTGLVLPIAQIVAALAERGVDTLVDGAHGPGMIDLDLEALGAAYYTGNLHKWVCAPKGAALLHVRPDRQARLRPAIISHGYSGRGRGSIFAAEFDWTGTGDPTAWLSVPAAIDAIEALAPGGWAEVRARCYAQLRRGRDRLAAALGVAPPAPDAMLGTLAALPLPPSDGPPPTSPLYVSPLQDALFERFAIEVPIVPWPHHPDRLVRISAFLYNDDADYERLADALTALLAEERAAT
ncbi:MAG: aminotransferase class V-fold PLP-dependent enzyme [Nannocystaceae bacterium]